MTEARMMSCDDALRLLAVYLDGELGDTSRHDVHAHLARCRSCFSRAEFERRLKGQLAAVGKRPVEPRLEDRIRELIVLFPPR